MKTLFIALGLALISSTSYAQKLLDCNLNDGDTQQAVVVQDGPRLILKELTARGLWQERTLRDAEWSAQKIRLYTRGAAEAYLYHDGHAWAFRYKSDGYNVYGYADCI